MIKKYLINDRYLQKKSRLKRAIALAPAAANAELNYNDKKVVFKSWNPFTHYISEIKNTQNNLKDIFYVANTSVWFKL